MTSRLALVLVAAVAFTAGIAATLTIPGAAVASLLGGCAAMPLIAVAAAAGSSPQRPGRRA